MHKYDLKQRTLAYSKDIIFYCKTIKETTVTKPIISQLIKSGTSIGANYCEATNASSPKDFRNKIFICKKEAEETKYWLMLSADFSIKTTDILNQSLLQETQELLLIFQKIISSTKV